MVRIQIEDKKMHLPFCLSLISVECKWKENKDFSDVIKLLQFVTYVPVLFCHGIHVNYKIAKKKKKNYIVIERLPTLVSHEPCFLV